MARRPNQKAAGGDGLTLIRKLSSCDLPKARKCDLAVLWCLDHFSRDGALATLRYLKELRDHGVNYKSFTEPYLDSLGPFGDVIVSMLATIAAQDLIKISESTRAALTKKKAAGIKLGTPGKSQAQIEQIRWLKSGGMSNYAIGKALKVSASTVAKYAE